MTRRILVVDDEEDIRILVSELLEQEGFEVSLAEDGPACLGMIKRQIPDLLIVDMMMPGMTGVQLCERIRRNKRTAGLRIIFLTVVKLRDLEDGKTTMKRLDVNGYVTKPFESRDLVSAVKKAMKTNS